MKAYKLYSTFSQATPLAVVLANSPEHAMQVFDEQHAQDILILRVDEIECAYVYIAKENE